MVSKKLKQIFHFFHTPNWLFAFLTLTFVLRIPSFFEPYSYGDEMIYLTLGNAIRKGVILYRSIHDNKPPLLYIMAAIAGNLFWFKVILALWSLVTIFLFWKLVCTLFPSPQKSAEKAKNNDSLQKVATVIFGFLTTLPLLEGNIVNSELFMIGPIIAALYILFSRKNNFKNIFFAGVLFSIATLFKVPAAFDLPAVIFIWFTQLKFNKKEVYSFIKNSLVLVLGFLIPILLTFVWFVYQGAFHEYLVAAYLQNFGYLSSWRPSDVQKPFLVKNGPLLIRSAIVALAGLILFVRRKKLSKNFIFISFWLFLTLFAVTLSERPYPHYLIQSVAPLSLLLGMLFTLKNIEQTLTIIPLTVAFFVPFYYKFWYYQTSSYYIRFINLAIGRLDKDEYLLSFGGNTLTNYKVASFVKSYTNPNDKVFVWGDGVVIYALSKRLPPGKYVADYHIKDFSTPQEVMNNLETQMPQLIIVTPQSDPFPQLTTFINIFYAPIEDVSGTKIYKLLSPSIRSYIAP